MYSVNKNTIAILMFSILILYQVIGVTIHSQYGFGIFYWPIQDYLLLILALFYILSNIDEIKLVYAPSSMYLYHFYVLALLLFELIYIWVMPETRTLDHEQKLTIFHDTIIYYFISLVLMLNFKRILSLITSKNMLIIYAAVIFFFFLYNFHTHFFLLHDGFLEALIIGQSLPTQVKEMLPGYSRGFHLFFSPLFVIFSLAVILKLKDDGKYFLLYFVSVLTLYVLMLAGGRGTLFSFFIVIFLFAFSRKAKVVTLIAIIVLFSFAQMLESLGLLNERMFDILTFNFEEDGSSQGRLEQFEAAILIIKNNYILGVLHPFQPGQYPHSILSVWEEYGLLPFVLLLAIISHGTYLFIFKKTEKTFIYLYAKSIFFATVLDHIFFKYTSQLNGILFIIIPYYFIVSNSILGSSFRNRIQKG